MHRVVKFPKPVPLAFVSERVSGWGWLRQKIKGKNSPEPKIATAVLEAIDLFAESGVPDDTSEVPGTGGEDEGRQYRIMSVLYERDPKNRDACVAHYGHGCRICGIELSEVYGPVLAKKIVVHHLTPLSTQPHAVRIDPRKDLLPVCPNCHFAIHQRQPPFSPEELVAMIAAAKKRGA